MLLLSRPSNFRSAYRGATKSELLSSNGSVNRQIHFAGAYSKCDAMTQDPRAPTRSLNAKMELKAAVTLSNGAAGKL